MQARPSVPGIERSFSSTPSLDTERQAISQRSRNWTPTTLSIFDHDISVDVLTGNLLVSTRDIGYKYHDFMFGVTRYYDAQEQFMRQSYLRNFVNVDPAPHWFGNWRFAYEATIEEVWHNATSELHISSGVGTNALFRETSAQFRRNLNDAAGCKRTLNTFGIPDRTLAPAALNWSFTPKDFLLRSIRGPFQIATGWVRDETLIDRVDARVWVFDPSSGICFALSTEFDFDIGTSGYRDIGQGMVVTRLVDSLGHAIELKALGGGSPFGAYLLSDGSARDIQIDLGTVQTYTDGLDNTRLARRYLVSKVSNKSKAAFGDIDYSYDSNFCLSQVQLPSSIGSRSVQYHYRTDVPVLTAIENSAGDQIQFEFEEDPSDCDERLNPRLKVKRIIDPEGVAFEYDYHSALNYTAVTLWNNGVEDQTVLYRYFQDTEGTKQRYVTTTEVDVKTGYTKDAAGNVVSIAAAAPQHVTNTFEYSRDGHFNIVKTIDPLNRSVSYTYNDFNQVESLTDFDGHLTQYQYDIPVNPNEYNPIGYDLISVTNPNLVRYLDPTLTIGFREQVDALQELFQYARYDANNSTVTTDIGAFSTHRLEQKTDVLSNVWLCGYDDVRNFSSLLPVLTSTPSGVATACTYNNRGERLTITDPYGNTHTNNFNAQGRLTGYTDPNGGATTFGYYPCGDWLSTITDQALKVINFTRDPDGAVSTIVDAVNDSVDFGYFKNGRLKRITKHRPAVGQDPTNAALTTIGVANVISELKYSPLGLVVSVVNPSGLELRFDFDESGRMYQWYFNQSGYSQPSKFLYDPSGQLTTIVNKSGGVTSYAYHNSGYLKQAQLPAWNNGSAIVPGKTVDYTYDYFGRVLTATDSEFPASREYCYDRAGSVIMRRDPGLHEFGFSYDADGRLYDVVNEDGAFWLHVTLDNLNRVTALHDSDALDGRLNWTYKYEKGTPPNRRVLNLFRRQSVELGLATDFDYDLKNRLTQVTTSGATAAYDQSIVYRDDDLVTQVLRSGANMYLYDGIKQLVFEALEPAHDDYDPAGNRLYKADRNINANPAPDVFNAVNQLTQTTAPPATLSYDPDGNSITTTAVGGPSTFYFDQQNQLRKVTGGPVEATYRYNFDGSLSEAIYRDVVSGVTDVFSFSFLFRRPVLIAKNGAADAILTWDADGRLLRIRKSSVVGGSAYPNSALPVYDFAGNIVALLDETGSVLAYQSFNAWGETQAYSDPKSINEFVGFKGGIVDPVTGLVLFGSRWYSPATGRWISQDPLVSNGNVATQTIMNLYAYVSNNPVAWFDPKGLDKILGIHSNVGPSDGFTAGHAWISVYDTDFRTLTTYGLWPDSHPLVTDRGPSSDVRVNMRGESNHTLYNRFYKLTKDEYRRLESFIVRDDEWGYTHTCADWAADAVMYAVGEDVDADDLFGFETPREISRSIIELEAKKPSAVVPIAIPDAEAHPTSASSGP